VQRDKFGAINFVTTCLYPQKMNIRTSEVCKSTKNKFVKYVALRQHSFPLLLYESDQAVFTIVHINYLLPKTQVSYHNIT